MEDWKLRYLKECKKKLEARQQVLQLQFNKIHEELQEAQIKIDLHRAEVEAKKKKTKPKGKKKK